ncbi:MAG: hypothetical protein RQ899_10745 [Pseudomonadales bacterium]|nr:hypothetical protein [Pseudomonadales bacterium]
MPDLFGNKEFIIFTTRDFALHEHLSLSAASKMLSRLQKKQGLTRITRGVWANTRHPWFHPLCCVPYLLGKEQGYVSFLTALHLHGMLSQIPATIQVATTGHTRRLESPQGVYEFIQMKPALMQQGLIWSETQLPYLQAGPEKALLDVLYIATRKKRRFASLPELELDTGSFHRKIFERMLAGLPLSPRISNAMAARARLLGAASHTEAKPKPRSRKPPVR